MHIPSPEELRSRRETLGLRQTEVAKRAGISQSMVARIEAGSVDPRVSTLNKIILVLNNAEPKKIAAGQIMHTPVLSVPPQASITQAVEIFEKNNISQLPGDRTGYSRRMYIGIGHCQGHRAAAPSPHAPVHGPGLHGAGFSHGSPGHGCRDRGKHPPAEPCGARSRRPAGKRRDHQARPDYPDRLNTRTLRALCYHGKPANRFFN